MIRATLFYQTLEISPSVPGGDFFSNVFKAKPWFNARDCYKHCETNSWIIQDPYDLNANLTKASQLSLPKAEFLRRCNLLLMDFV